MRWAKEDAEFAAQLHAGGDAYETCNDVVEAALFRMAQQEARAALNWLRARRPEAWGPRTPGPTLNLQQSFQQVNVQQLSDSALAEYQAMLESPQGRPQLLVSKRWTDARQKGRRSLHRWVYNPVYLGRRKRKSRQAARTQDLSG